VTSTDYVGALLERAGQNNRAISTAKPKKPAQLGDRATGVAGNSSPVPAERRGDTGEVLSALARRAAWAHEPDRIAFYLYDLASEFHAQQNNGNDAPHLRFIIKNDPQMTKTRLALNLLGVGAEMR
jgi:hypothetical protein